MYFDSSAFQRRKRMPHTVQVSPGGLSNRVRAWPGLQPGLLMVSLSSALSRRPTAPTTAADQRQPRGQMQTWTYRRSSIMATTNTRRKGCTRKSSSFKDWQYPSLQRTFQRFSIYFSGFSKCITTVLSNTGLSSHRRPSSRLNVTSSNWEVLKV